MKALNLMIYIGLVFLFSCSKQDDLLSSKLTLSSDLNHPLPENRQITINNCQTCNALKNITLTEVKKLGEICTEYKLSWDYNRCYGFQTIRINGKQKAYLSNAKKFTFTSCDNYVKVQIIGFNEETGKWEDICFEKNLSNISEHNYNLTQFTAELLGTKSE